MVNKVDEGLGAGGLQRTDGKVVAESLQSGFGHGPKVVALRTAAADQSVELLYASLVAGPVGVGKEDAGRFVQHRRDGYLAEGIPVIVRGKGSESVDTGFEFMVSRSRHRLGEFVGELRLERARGLLRMSSVRIAEIADQCGFTSPYSFSRAFKNRFRRIRAGLPKLPSTVARERPPLSPEPPFRSWPPLRIHSSTWTAFHNNVNFCCATRD